MLEEAVIWKITRRMWRVKKQQELKTGVSSSCHTNQPNLLLLRQR